MPRKPMRWVYSPSNKSKPVISSFQKTEIEDVCKSLIEKFKKLYIKKNPDKRFNYGIDLFMKWRGSSLYFIQKLKSEQKGMPDREFNVGFARLEFVKKDCFNLSYFRHTGQWFRIASDLTLNDSLEMIEGNSFFHPI